MYGATLDECRARHRQALKQHCSDVLPGEYQSRWRYDPVATTRDIGLLTLAVCDALIEQGSVAAWPGDGVACVVQMLDAQMQRAERAERALVLAQRRLSEIRMLASNISVIHDTIDGRPE